MHHKTRPCEKRRQESDALTADTTTQQGFPTVRVCTVKSAFALSRTGELKSWPPTLTKYCGGSGSWTGMVKVMVWSSSANAFFSRKYSLWSSVSLSLSSTSTQKGSTKPCTLSSHWKSGVTVRSTCAAAFQGLSRPWTMSPVEVRRKELQQRVNETLEP